MRPLPTAHRHIARGREGDEPSISPWARVENSERERTTGSGRRRVRAPRLVVVASPAAAFRLRIVNELPRACAHVFDQSPHTYEYIPMRADGFSSR